jgi:hypothetical protein
MPPLIDAVYGLAESDLLRIPTAAGYVDYPLANLIDVGGGPLRSTSNFGLPPVRFITQRGPFQDGETALDMRLDPRVIQIEVVNYLGNRSEFWTTRNELLDLIRPNRAFSASGDYNPLIYRKRLPGGKVERGSDGESDGAGVFTSDYGRFVHYGGLQVNDRITIAGTEYIVREVVNDYTLLVSTGAGAFPPLGTEQAWRYVRNNAIRDIDVLLEQGPNFNEQIGAYRHPEGYREALRFVAHNPTWYGVQQAQSWALDAALGDLVFDLAGAWFGTVSGVGRWLFAPSFVGETVSVVYWGTWPAKPTIIINGPATNPSINNTTIGVQLNLAYTVAAAETVTIDTLNLTVTNNAGANLLPYLSGDLATFEISPPPQAPNRENQVTVNFADAVAGQSNATLYWKNRYIGI